MYSSFIVQDVKEQLSLLFLYTSTWKQKLFCHFRTSDISHSFITFLLSVRIRKRDVPCACFSYAKSSKVLRRGPKKEKEDRFFASILLIPCLHWGFVVHAWSLGALLLGYDSPSLQLKHGEEKKKKNSKAFWDKTDSVPGQINLLVVVSEARQPLT